MLKLRFHWRTHIPHSKKATIRGSCMLLVAFIYLCKLTKCLSCTRSRSVCWTVNKIDKNLFSHRNYILIGRNKLMDKICHRLRWLCMLLRRMNAGGYAWECVRVRACLCSIAAAKVLKSCREDLTEMVTFEDLKGLREWGYDLDSSSTNFFLAWGKSISFWINSHFSAF